MNDIHDERLEMVNDFVTESRELLDEIEPQIHIMEEHASNLGIVDNEILNSIFRLFHSIKGMASFLDLQTVMNVTHEAETLLDIFRKHELPLDTKHIDLLYRSSDFLRNLLDNIEKQLSDSGFEDAAEIIIDEIKETICSVDTKSQDITAKIDEAVSEVAATIEVDLPEVHMANSLDELKIKITPEMVQKFIAEALDNFEDAEAALLKLEKDPLKIEYVEQAFRAFHSFKGNAGFFGYSDFEQISHKAENILDDVRWNQKAPGHDVISALLETIDVVRKNIHILSSSDTTVKEKDRLLTLLDNVEKLHGEETQENNPQKLVVEAKVVNDTGASEIINESVKKINTINQQAIRVDLEKLDTLLDLVGELVIAEAMVSRNPDLNGLQLPRFEKAVMQLGKITREIQDVSMSMRMIPLSGTFRKMVRLVRDVSIKADKKVSLDIIGEETEVDKTIIEQISDPLVHIIRNAVDHGIETTDERYAAGKPEVGHLTLEAKHSAGEVWITIKDDGKGLNRERILEKAIKRGLISDENRELKDEEVWKLIFEPGLSTADKVSSISGRGVGMDVVKRNIEKLRGRVDIKSVQGEGTVFAIRIPLTLAIIEGMVVQVGKANYTIPIISIKESFQPLERQITITPDLLEVVNVRGELLPVIRLHELYKVKPKSKKLTEGLLIVVESNGQKCCLFVDELIGQHQIVIKGLPEYLGNVRGISGLAILGDGEVSMILDVSNLINSVEGLMEVSQVKAQTV